MKFVKTPEYYEALRLRKIWCEGNFAQQKTWHNLRRTYKRGIERVTEQCLLSACALNLKRLVKAAKAAFSFALFAIFLSFSEKRGALSTAPFRSPLYIIRGRACNYACTASFCSKDLFHSSNWSFPSSLSKYCCISGSIALATRSMASSGIFMPLFWSFCFFAI